ncbi:MAG: DNA-3-methyladenine glycosylase I [Pseudomonadales bacterium]|nr:DNA-3-methyladenine glycosylase I [Pseudomonadales bacterium]
MKRTEKFQRIYERACKRKGGEQGLKSLLKKPVSTKKLKRLGDDRFLAEFTKKVFQSGFVWRVVERKWPAFEQAFFKFNINVLLHKPDEFFEEIASNPAIIRNYRKVQAIQHNALMIHEVQCQGTSFAEFVADWPSEDIVGLWAYLKKHGSRLGGNTGPYALRALGKDTFLLSRDVEQYLQAYGVFTGSSSSKRSRDQVQAFFNTLHQDSGYSYQHLSQIISFSTGDNFVLPESAEVV